MPVQSAGLNAVATANNVNPSIVTERWLMRHGIVADGDFDGASVYTPPFVKVRTRGFELIVLEDRIQIGPSSEADSAGAFQSFVRLIETLPHTPYQAVGLNFVWGIIPNEGTAADLARRLFPRQDGALERVLGGNETTYGGFASRPALGGALNLELKVLADVLTGSFNYHYAVGADIDGRVELVVDAINHWAPARDDSRRIAEALSRG